VKVTIFQRSDLSGEFEVDGSGRLALPLIGGVEAAGLTLPELEEVISGRLNEERLLDASVSVSLLKTRPVCVLGEVVKPGCFQYFHGMRVASALAMAGGYTYRARKNEVDITRENGDKLSGNHDTLVYPGDIIEVGGRLF
jgi:polysaccharide export outer membrane protein